MPMKLKEKVYKNMSPVVYEAESWATTKRRDARIGVNAARLLLTVDLRRDTQR